jgi:hypothetical protein
MSGDKLSKFEQEIGQVADLTRDDLAASWQKMFGALPPKGVKRGILERAYAYRLQARCFGGLKPATRKKLLAMTAEGKAIRAGGPEPGNQSVLAGQRRNGITLEAGTRLIREWNGIIHQVEVVEGGFVWNDRTMSSLSAVARAITGTNWSGPRFFGL